ncbi:hypothetical protein AB0G73_14210 [Streptomyces sp. NPDC020719]|uniref:hypothetical protein n=1 Tax=Streptomyces sp. NPDC020719 TaxID=3154896 RepID=UPI003402659F
MNELTHDPLTILQVSTEHGITEQQAETAMTWASHMLIHAWSAYADFWGLDSEDGAAMEKWGAQLDTQDRQAILGDAVNAVKAADDALGEAYRSRDAEQAKVRGARPMRTNRPHIRIR